MSTSKKIATGNSENGGEQNPSATNTQVNRKPSIPTKDSDFGTLLTNINNKWKTVPALTLLHITQPVFETKVILFNKTLADKQQASGNISPIASQLAEKDELINKGISGIKGYLKDKYEEKATSYYALFGIVKKGSRYVLPEDRDKREDALELIVNAIASEGFGSKKYGTSFWTQLKADYSALLTKANSNTGKVSTGVGTKNSLREELEEVVECIRHLIMANYPKNRDAELRNWGFVKEKY